MINETIFQLHIVVNRKDKEQVSKDVCAAGAKFLNVTYGRGSLSHRSNLRASLGLVVEPKKAFITCLAKAEDTDAIFEMLITKHNFNAKNTGFAFATPLNEITH